jgi:hypothetical protein
VTVAPPDGDPVSRAWQEALGRLSSEWTTLRTVESHEDGLLVERWAERFRSLEAEVGAFRSAGRWRSGPRSLLSALGLHKDELKLTAALAWLLQPDGHHGLGDGFLRRLCERVRLEPTAFGPVTVHPEETRADTRADLIVRMPGAALLIEAKVRAPEQRRQCARLAELWEAEEPALIFLTSNGRPPRTAEASLDRWTNLSWVDMSQMIAAAAVESEEAAPGVLEVVATLQGDD